MKSEDVKVGDKFNRWTVIAEASKEWDGKVHLYYRNMCQCECGTIKNVKTTDLFSNNPSKSCGCLQKEVSSRVKTEVPLGVKYGRLTVDKVIASVKSGKKSRRMVSCSCDCGAKGVELRWDMVKSGHTKSCGCYYTDSRHEITKTHGMVHSPEHSSWTSMKQRCNNPNAPGYMNYGGRGITYDPLWEKFENFYADMGERPEGTSLERKDNDLGYFKENCEWASRTQQSFNQRKHANCSSIYSGVYYDNSKSNWVARIHKELNTRWIGSFSTEIEAARAYDRACIEWYGVTKNFPLEDYLKEK